MTHRTGTGHIPAARSVSWGCTCGASQVLTYGDTFRPEWAMRVVHARAAAHRTLTDLKETPCNPGS